MNGEETRERTVNGDETRAEVVNESGEGSKDRSAGGAIANKEAGGGSVRTPTSGSYKRKGSLQFTVCAYSIMFLLSILCRKSKALTGASKDVPNPGRVG